MKYIYIFSLRMYYCDQIYFQNSANGYKFNVNLVINKLA